MRLTQERLKELLYYNPDVGEFTWLVTVNNNKAIKGNKAGSIDDTGYRSIGVDGSRYYAHRLSWLYTYGYLPEHGVDHIDRGRLNNNIGNLREVSKVCNARNTGNPLNNTSGVKGVCWDNRSSKWEAYIKVNQVKRGLGLHKDFTEAVCHRLAAEQAEDWAGCDSSSPAYKYIKSNIIMEVGNCQNV